MTPEQAAAALLAPARDEVFQRPYSGLGRMTLREYAAEYGHDLDVIQGILRGAGLDPDPDARLREEAGRLGTDPEGILDVLNREAAG
jgi:hypothetical protein